MTGRVEGLQYRIEKSGCNSVVECNLPKVEVEGSNPFTRSIFVPTRGTRYAMKLTCPHCGKIVVIPEEFTGKEDICPHCFEYFDVSKQILKWKTAFKEKSDTETQEKTE